MCKMKSILPVARLFAMLGTRCLVLPILVISALAQSVPTDPLAMPGSNVPNRAAAYPNILLVTLDTTRADRMDFLGSKRGLTPNLDLLARDATVFTRAYSQAPL